MLRLATTCLATILATSVGSAAQTPIERGSYLVNSIMACGNCHTPKGPGGAPINEKHFSGGSQMFNQPAFVVKGSNITPDRETGIGTWSDADIKRALTEGVRPNGVLLAPVMPYGFFKMLTPRDLDAVVAYLRSVAPVRNDVTPPVYKTAFTAERYPVALRMTEGALQEPVKRGYYLATIGHCMACHTGRPGGVRDYKNALGKGGEEFRGPGGASVAANITAHPTSGIGPWSDADIKRAITQGISRDGHALKPPMPYAWFARLTDEDLNALVSWLRTLPPIE